jgi:hypothetical protein
MTTKTLLQILTLSLVVVSCGQPNPNPIDRLQVDSIVIYYNHPDDTIAPPPRKLSVTSIKKFADDWNKTCADDICKYYPYYLITVYHKDKTKREFRVNGQNIKERTDECFNLNDPDYFDKLWEANK